MDEVTTMTISPAMPSPGISHNQSQSGLQTVSVLAVAPTFSQLPSGAGATVYIASSTAPKADSPLARSTVIPKVQSVNDCRVRTTARNQFQQPAHIVKIKINPQLDDSRVISTVRLAPDQKNPQDNKSECLNNHDNNVIKLTAKTISDGEEIFSESCVRINVVNDAENLLDNNQRDKMIQRISTETINTSITNRSTTGFYYGSYQSPISTIVMSSGQSSPSDTLDSGTCSDLDGTPPPLPKKKNSSTVLLGAVVSTGQHTRTGSLTSSGTEVDSDDNESNISCDSLNRSELAAQAGTNKTLNCIDVLFNESDELSNDSNKHPTNETPRVTRDLDVTMNELEHVSLNSNNNNENDVNKNYSKTNVKSSDKLLNIADVISNSTRASPSNSPSSSRTSSLSKSSSTPRVQSPNPLVNGRQQQEFYSPVVQECTYEERKTEQNRLDEENTVTEHYTNYNRDNGTKYVYEDDRFYKFHINELVPADNHSNTRKKLEDNETEEYFAGYKILDKEAIRSAKGTVRGVKNRVRAGIATFLQNPSSKVSIRPLDCFI